MNIEKPMRVAEYAEVALISKSSVRRAIAKGFLKVDEKVKPMVIVGGELPLTVMEWKRALDPATAQLKPGLWGWAENGALEVLVGNEIASVKPSDRRGDIPRAEAKIAELAKRQTKRLVAA